MKFTEIWDKQVIVDNRPGTSAGIAAEISADIVRIVRQPDMRERLAEQGVEVVGNQPDEFARFIRTEIENFRRVAATGGISVQ